jgi:CheY-like chemotaxis protein
MPPMELLELRLPASLYAPQPPAPAPAPLPPSAPATAPPAPRAEPVRVPTAAPPPSPPPSPRPPAAASRRAGAPPPPTHALLVDDSDVALRFLELRLERFGLETQSVATSTDALRLLEHRGYDFVFLDMELGEASELDGLALCQLIKRDHAARVPPPLVIMVSAHHTEMDRVRATLAGCDALLGKPLDDAELERLMRRHGLKPTLPAGE